jgi:hypothetical protein
LGRARLNLPGQSGGAVYAIPRAELSGKTANFSRVKRGARTRHVVFTWRILIFMFYSGLLAVPPEDMNLEDAPLYHLWCKKGFYENMVCTMVSIFAIEVDFNDNLFRLFK